MKKHLKHEGVVVPMVTPLTDSGALDRRAVERLVDFLLEGGVNGIFVLGTTGEGSGVRAETRRQLVERVVNRVQSRVLVYAGVGELQPEPIAAGNDYLAMGVDAVVARSPIGMAADDMAPWFSGLLEGTRGPVILYNIPILTKVSIPLDLIERFECFANLVGIKDSENNLNRLTKLIQRYGDRPGFSIFVGVGKWMEQGLELGAHGIVPSVGNLIPDVCRGLWECAQRKDWSGAKRHAERMNTVAAVYQADRDLGESLSALKAALGLKGICERFMAPPLEALVAAETSELAKQLDSLGLVNASEKLGSGKSSQIAPASRLTSGL